MTATKTISMLTLIASLSAAGLVVGTEGAFARDRNHNDHEHQQSHNADNKDKQANKKKNKKKEETKVQCITQPCGSQSSSTTTSTQSQGAGGTRAVNTGQSRSAATGNTSNTIYISNGVKKIAITPGTGQLTVSSNKKDGTITVYNGEKEVTLRGGSLVVSGAGVQSGAVFTQSTPDTQSMRNAQGEMVFAIK